MEKIEPDQLVAILDEDSSLFAIGITVKKIASGKAMWDVRMSYARPGQRPSIIKESRLKVLKPLSKEEVQSLSPAEAFKKHRQEIIDGIIEQAKEKEEEINEWFQEENIDLNEALEKYQQGMELINKCKGELKKAENQFEDIKKKYVSSKEESGE